MDSIIIIPILQGGTQLQQVLERPQWFRFENRKSKTKLQKTINKYIVDKMQVDRWIGNNLRLFLIAKKFILC